MIQMDCLSKDLRGAVARLVRRQYLATDQEPVGQSTRSASHPTSDI